MSEATYRMIADQQDYTPLVAVLAGLVILMADGRAGVVQADLAAAQKGSIIVEGILDFNSASATVFVDGEDVWWDDTNNLAVKTGISTATFRLGTAVGAKASGALVVRVDLNARAFGGCDKIAEAVADSAAVTNTVTETIVGTVTIPANRLKTGTIIEFLAALIATATNSTDTFQGRVRLGGVAGTVVADTTAIDLANSDVGVLKGQIVIRTDGAGGTFVAASQSQMKTTSNPLVSASVAIDTTAAITLVFTIQESVASAGNSAVAREFNVFLR